jgi:hypothetical protein
MLTRKLLTLFVSLIGACIEVNQLNNIQKILHVANNALAFSTIIGHTMVLRDICYLLYYWMIIL